MSSTIVRRAQALTAALAVSAALLTGCAAPAPGSSSAVPASVLTSAPTAAPEPAPGAVAGSAADASPLAELSATPSAGPEQPLAGKLIIIDPGHNGVWTKKLRKLVPAGNGRKKPCNSSGTATNSGYAEHAYNWSQANALAAELRSRGAEVLLTRSNDTSQGPCVNLRSKLANDRSADLLISIHADGNYARSARGFHVIISTTMVGGNAVEAASRRLAKTLRGELESQTAMPRSTYIGKGTALSPRTDIATLNLSKRVGVMLEMGNMRHAKDAALLKSAKFRGQVAVALADGITEHLG